MRISCVGVNVCCRGLCVGAHKKGHRHKFGYSGLCKKNLQKTLIGKYFKTFTDIFSQDLFINSWELSLVKFSGIKIVPHKAVCATFHLYFHTYQFWPDVNIARPNIVPWFMDSMFVSKNINLDVWGSLVWIKIHIGTLSIITLDKGMCELWEWPRIDSCIYSFLMLLLGMSRWWYCSLHDIPLQLNFQAPKTGCNICNID